jgi:hypothetical protein
MLYCARGLRRSHEAQPTTNYGCELSGNWDHWSQSFGEVEIPTQYQTPCTSDTSDSIEIRQARERAREEERTENKGDSQAPGKSKNSSDAQ